MLKNAHITTTLPSTDIKRTRDFYVGKLGLKLVEENDGSILLEAGGSTRIYIYERPPSRAEHTLASFEVPDLEAAVDGLSKNGVTFEHYDMPGLKTDEKGIAVWEEEGEKSAWFKDPDGNILAVSQKI